MLDACNDPLYSKLCWHSYKVVENVVATCTLLQQASTSTMHAYSYSDPIRSQLIERRAVIELRD